MSIIELTPCWRAQALHREAACSKESCAEKVDKQMKSCIPALNNVAVPCIDGSHPVIYLKFDECTSREDGVYQQHEPCDGRRCDHGFAPTSKWAPNFLCISRIRVQDSMSTKTPICKPGLDSVVRGTWGMIRRMFAIQQQDRLTLCCRRAQDCMPYQLPEGV